jgi:hypothetical protein
MRSVMRLLLGVMPVTVAAAVVLMFAATTALPAAANQEETMLVITVQPTTTQVNTAMTPAVVVHVDNSAGVPVNSFGGPVTLSYVPGSSTIPNPPPPTGNTVNAKKGVATFSGLTFSAAGGFELQASAPEVNLTSAPSVQFSIVTQAVQCQPGQPCQTGTVSDAGTSGFAVASAGSGSDVLTATGGGFPTLSCTSMFLGGGVLTFTVTNRSKTITLMLDKDLVLQNVPPGSSHFTICWGSANPFTTADGSTSLPNPKNGNEFEGLVAKCPLPPGSLPSSPCIASQNKTGAGVEVATISVPPGDGHITW